MKPNKNVVGWFEIPVVDMDRAVKFYETVFGFKLMRHDEMGALEMAFFPYIGDTAVAGAAGALVKHPAHYQPATSGTLVYFTAWSGDVQNELDRAEKAGGKILIPKRQITPEHGFMGAFEDSEGNRIAVHCR